MFSKLLDDKELPLKEQKEVLKAVLTTNLKQNVHEVRLQFNHNYLHLKPVLLQHWKYALRLALALHSWQVALEVLEGKTDKTPAADLVYSLLAQDAAVRGQYLIVDLGKSFPDSWRTLVILKLAAENVVKHLSPKDYAWFLATFVRLSASAIQSFLTLKN